MTLVNKRASELLRGVVGTELNFSAQEKWAAVSSACFGITGMCLDRTSSVAAFIELHGGVTRVSAAKPALEFVPIFFRCGGKIRKKIRYRFIWRFASHAVLYESRWQGWRQHPTRWWSFALIKRISLAFLWYLITISAEDRFKKTSTLATGRPSHTHH